MQSCTACPLHLIVQVSLRRTLLNILLALFAWFCTVNLVLHCANYTPHGIAAALEFSTLSISFCHSFSSPPLLLLLLLPLFSGCPKCPWQFICHSVGGGTPHLQKHLVTLVEAQAILRALLPLAICVGLWGIPGAPLLLKMPELNTGREWRQVLEHICRQAVSAE
eukprot:1161084-Pelagomonas_calceolata.AAC.15